MEANSQLPSCPFYSPECPRYPLNIRTCGPHSCSSGFGEEKKKKIPCHNGESNRNSGRVMIQASSDRYLAAECGVRCQASPVVHTEGPRDGLFTVFRALTLSIIPPVPSTHHSFVCHQLHMILSKNTVRK